MTDLNIPSPDDALMIAAIKEGYTTKPLSRAEQEAFDISLIQRRTDVQRKRQASVGAGLVLVLLVGAAWVLYPPNMATVDEPIAAVTDAPRKVTTPIATAQGGAVTRVDTTPPDLSVLIHDEPNRDMDYLPGDYQALLAMTHIH